MSDEQERDAAVIAQFRERLQRYKAENEGRSWTTTYYIPDVVYRDVSHSALRELDRLTAERDAARAEVERLRDILRRLLDAFGTPATRETETNLSEAMTAYEAANMKDEAHVLRTSIEAIRAALGIEADHD